jgi:hypothetical protein
MGDEMIDAVSNSNMFSTAWQYIGPLIGVGFGYLISNKVWGWQKRWEMKRDAVSDVVKWLGLMNYALRDIQYHKGRDPDQKDLEHFDLCRDNFEHSRCIADLVVSKQLRKALIECREAILDIADYYSNPLNDYKDPKVPLGHRQNRDQKIDAVYDLARKELNIKSDDSIVAEN